MKRVRQVVLKNDPGNVFEELTKTVQVKTWEVVKSSGNNLSREHLQFNSYYGRGTHCMCIGGDEVQEDTNDTRILFFFSLRSVPDVLGLEGEVGKET